MKQLIVLFITVFPSICLSSSQYINEIADFTQTDVKGKNSGNGQQYCAPVAVSNSLVWLGDQKDQLSLIRKLASKQYMNTSLKNGTGTTGVLRGVERISKALFGGYEYLEYEGWRKHPTSYSRGVKRPDIERLKSAVSRRSSAWVNVGWYQYSERKNEYKRVGGHWITLVGSNGKQLIFHDPAPRAGGGFSNEFVNYSIINSGMLVGRKSGLPTKAKGYISLERGMHIKSSADFAIIDGVVYFGI